MDGDERVGWREALRAAGAWIAGRYDEHQEREFDRHWGTDTTGIIDVADLDTRSPNRRFSARYQPTTEVYCRRMFDALAIAYERYTFVDLGSGKGRAVMIAAHYPFRRLVGVEYAASLHAIAQRNVALYCRKSGREHPFELHCCDAVEYDFPPEPLVVYLYNPFGAPVLDTVLRRLCASLSRAPRPARVVYRNPCWASVFDRYPALRRVHDGPDWHLYEHAPAPDATRVVLAP